MENPKSISQIDTKGIFVGVTGTPENWEAPMRIINLEEDEKQNK